MARFHDEPPLRRDDVEEVVAGVCFPDRADERRPGRVGLEIERFPIRRHPSGAPAGRLAIDATLAVLAQAASDDRGEPEMRSGIPAVPVPGGGRVTFEPGGQVEHVTAVHDTARTALEEVSVTSGALAAALDDAGVTLASAGTDVWTDVESVPLQLDSYRYPAMDAYFSARGSLGRVMMRHTCALQVSLDLGPAPERGERWTLANLLAPLLTATFATSPADGVVCSRAGAWQVIDPTRTGFPRGLVGDRPGDPVAQMAATALAADVLLVRTGPSAAEPGRPGWTFGDWLHAGDARYGSPTAGDLAYHLSTIFLEVRPRGMLEFRGIDAVPHQWRAVPITLLVGALEDLQARSRLLDLLEPYRRTLPALWRQASATGVADPAFCALTVEAWSYALGGASRLAPAYVASAALTDTEAFLERFTLRGRCPADELRERLTAGPAASLAWAAEPVPEQARRFR